jgi:histidinol-phosphatase (PHP family)
MQEPSPIPALPDYHIHTPLCNHAAGEPSEFRAAALSRGIPEICFTDHCPTPDGYDPAHRMELAGFPLYMDMVMPLQDGNTPHCLFGIEADYYEGCEAFLGTWLPEQAFDLVIGSVHFIDGWGFDNPEERHLWDSVDVAATWIKYFKLIGRLADSGLFDAVGHLDLPKKFGHRPSDKEMKEMAAPVLDRIAGAGMGLELNTSGLRKPVKEIYPSPLLVSMARERDIPICFGSDSHKPVEVGTGFKEALSVAREAGYTHHFTVRRRRMELVKLP